jgi:hypothetical protein
LDGRHHDAAPGERRAAQYNPAGATESLVRKI